MSGLALGWTLIAGAALAEERPREFVRVGATAGAGVGTRLVGSGTREPLRTVGGAMRADAIRYPIEPLGLAMGFRVGAATPDGTIGAVGGGIELAPVRWPSGLFALGAGAELELGHRPSHPGELRGLPWLGARVQAGSAIWRGYALVRASPTSTDVPGARRIEAELGAGPGPVRFGIAAELEHLVGGDPRRWYAVGVIGPAVSLVVE